MAFPVDNLTASATGSNSIRLSWSGMADHPLTTDYYYIRRSDDGGSTYGRITGQLQSYSGNQIYDDVGLTDGKLHYYDLEQWTLEFVNDVPTWVEYSSNVASATTLLAAPSGLTGSAGPDYVYLEWTDNSQNESGFKIYKNGAYWDTVGANVTTYNGSGLSQGTWYNFTVRAYNASTESANSNTLSLLTTYPPAAPSNLTGQGTSTSAIKLTWKDNDNTETGFKVERSAVSGTTGFTQIATVNANVTTYTNTGLAAGTKYWFRVRAYNDAGNSGYSNVVSPSTLEAIATPTALEANALSSTVIEIRFTDNSTAETNHRVERKTNSASPTPPIDLSNETWSGNPETERIANPSFETWTNSTTPANWTKLFDGRVARESTIVKIGNYSAKLTFESGDIYTGVRSAVTLTASAAYKLTLWHNIPSGANGKLLVTDVGQNVYMKSDGTWGAFADCVEINLAGTGSWTKYERTFTAHADYTAYRVDVGTDGVSVYSFYVDGFSLLRTDDPPVYDIETDEPDHVTVDGEDIVERASLEGCEDNAGSWFYDTDTLYIHLFDGGDPNSGNYEILNYTDSSGTYSEIVQLAPNRTYYKNTGLTAGTSYTYRVRAYNSSGGGTFSAYSNEATAVTVDVPSAPVSLEVSENQDTYQRLSWLRPADLNLDPVDLTAYTWADREEANHVTDGGFEAWTDANTLTYWDKSGAGALERESTIKKTGNYSAKITRSGSDVCIVITPDAYRWTLSVGRTYRLIVWHYTPIGNSARIQLHNVVGGTVYYWTGSQWTTTLTNNDDAGTGDWKKFETDFSLNKVGGVMQSDNYRVRFNHTANSYSYYLDAVSVLPVYNVGYKTTFTGSMPYRIAHNGADLTKRATMALMDANAGSWYYDEDGGELYLHLTGDADPDDATTLVAYYAYPAGDDEAGFKIYRSTDSGSTYSQVGQTHAGVLTYKATGLTPETEYYWTVKAYNAAGESVASNSANATTLAQYEPTAFERLIRRSSPRLVYLVELNPMMELAGWTLTDGRTKTYETAWNERGLPAADVLLNGVSMTARTSIAGVELMPGSYYHDVSAGKIYVHPTASDTPANYLALVSFWMYFTSWQPTAGPMVHNGNYYLPLVPGDGIPDISQELQEYEGSNLIVTTGSVSLINAKINGQFHFDRLFDRYYWHNRRCRILAGGEEFDYEDYAVINTGTINSISITDQRFVVDLRDYRDGLQVNVPIDRYSTEDFPNIASGAAGQLRPVGYGVVTNAVPYLVDSTRQTYEFNAGPVVSVESVYEGASALTENTDYFVDYGRGQFTLSSGYSVTGDFTVNFTGKPDAAGVAIKNPADLFYDIMTEYLGLSTSEIDFDSLYKSREALTDTDLSLYLWQEINTQDIIRRIEQSVRGHSAQDAEGRIGFRLLEDTMATNAKRLPPEWVLDFSKEFTQDALFGRIEVNYNENPALQNFSIFSRTLTNSRRRYGSGKTLTVTVALADVDDVEDLVTAVIAELGKPAFTFTAPRLMFDVMPGDLIYFNRARFPGVGGIASNMQARVLSVAKNLSSGTTTIKARAI